MKDSEIIELYWARSEAAIVETKEAYGSYCHSISYHILHSHEDAEECVNDTYWKAWNSIPPQRPDRLSAFLGKITRNLSLGRYRSLSRQKRGAGQVELVLGELSDCIASPDDVEQRIEDDLLLKCINDFLYQLPELKRNIFIRQYWYLYSIAELAVQFGMSENKVSLLLLRMRKSLRSHLDQEGVAL